MDPVLNAVQAFVCSFGMLILVNSACAITRYVNPKNPTPEWPYTSWDTAATNIQSAVDAAEPGDLILVTNGVYATGTRAVYGMPTRLAVTKPLTVQSVNGPEVTIIRGSGPSGANAVRCVYLTNGAALVGFTITNGATQTTGDPQKQLSGGGIWCESTDAVVSNCVIAGNSAQENGGGAYRGTLHNCMLIGNSAYHGGGAYGSTLINCTVIENSGNIEGGGAFQCTLINCTLATNNAQYGGGCYRSTLDSCVLIGNSALFYGGGAHESALNGCTILSNRVVWYGGGAAQSTLTNCLIIGNSAEYYGGGVFWSTLNFCSIIENSGGLYGGGVTQSTLTNCTLSANHADSGGGAYNSTLNSCVLCGNKASYGGGAYFSTLNNCTLTGNWATEFGGGAYKSTLNNCILYYNRAGIQHDNYYDCTMQYCCATPLPPGAGNLDVDPLLASAFRLSSISPCRSRGTPAYASGLDIDGEQWANPPSIGCDEYWSGLITGNLSVKISAPYTNVALGFLAHFQAVIDGRVSASVWDFGDGTVVSNRPWISHAWSAPGTYTVELRAYNDTHPAGVATTLCVHVVERPVHYVARQSTNPVPPYNSWETAATNIQDAVDVVTVAGALILVTNGMYETGARLVNGMNCRVAITKPVTVKSVDGPSATIIRGFSPNGPYAVRCVYLTNGAALVGFTITNGATQTTGDPQKQLSGGGIWCESTDAVVSNCVIAGNSAQENGGGAYHGTLHNCTLIGNSAGKNGGGVYGGTLNNCTLSGNSANYGGGASRSTLNNSILYYNHANVSGDNYHESTAQYSCTTPLPPGTGNLDAHPLFEDTNCWRNLRLQPNSPCINRGNNNYAPGPNDLDGNPRIAGGRVDIGAYEFQGAGLSEFALWLWRFGLPTDGSASVADSDLDGMNNWQEWQADTNPTNALSVLWILSILPGPPVSVQFNSSTNCLYTLWFNTNLSEGYWTEVDGQRDVPGTGALQTLVDTNSTSPRFFRVSTRRQ